MSTSGEEVRYYLRVDGSEDGPLRLGELLDAGLTLETLVRVEGSDAWRPAHELPRLARLLGDEERRLRKAERKARDLPDPVIFGKLRATIVVVDVTAGLLCILGTTTLLTALVLLFTSRRAASLAFLAGLAPALGGVTLLVVEAVLLSVFIAKCGRVVDVLLPGRDTATSWHDWLQEDLDGANVFDDVNDPMAANLAAEGLGYGAPMVVGSLMMTVVMAVVLCVTIGPLLLIFVPLYTPLALAIYRLGYGLNNVVDRYRFARRGVPWAPIALGLWTALAGLLMLAGPLAGGFFVLVPIWVCRTARVAIAICETYPARFAKDRPAAEPSADPPLSPLGIPPDAKPTAT